MKVASSAILIAITFLVGATAGQAQTKNGSPKVKLRAAEESATPAFYDFKLSVTQSAVVHIEGRKKPTARDTEVWQLNAVEEERAPENRPATRSQLGDIDTKAFHAPTLDLRRVGANRSVQWLEFDVGTELNGETGPSFTAKNREALKDLGAKPRFAMLGVFMRDPICYRVTEKFEVEELEMAGVFVSLGARMSESLRASVASRYQLLIPDESVKIGDSWTGAGCIKETAFDPKGSIPEIAVRIEAKLAEKIDSGPATHVVIEQIERPEKLPLEIKPRFGLPLEIRSCEHRRRFAFNLEGHLVSEVSVLECQIVSTMTIAGRKAQRVLDLTRRCERQRRPDVAAEEEKD